MSDLKGLTQVLLSPRITEKTTMCQEYGNQVIFKVALSANKMQIKAAVEKMFDVNVKAVQTSHVQGKKKRFGKIIGQRKPWKKAVVRLEDGQTIDFFESN